MNTFFENCNYYRQEDIKIYPYKCKGQIKWEYHCHKHLILKFYNCTSEYLNLEAKFMMKLHWVKYSKEWKRDNAFDGFCLVKVFAEERCTEDKQKK